LREAYFAGAPSFGLFKKSLRDIENVIESIKRLLFFIMNERMMNCHCLIVILQDNDD